MADYFGITGAKFIYGGDYSDDSWISYKGFLYSWNDFESLVEESFEESGLESDDYDFADYWDDPDNTAEIAYDLEFLLSDFSPYKVDKKLFDELEDGYDAERLLERLNEWKSTTNIPDNVLDGWIKECKAIVMLEHEYENSESDELYDTINDRYSNLYYLIEDSLNDKDIWMKWFEY